VEESEVVVKGDLLTQGLPGAGELAVEPSLDPSPKVALFHASFVSLADGLVGSVQVLPVGFGFGENGTWKLRNRAEQADATVFGRERPSDAV
jgi:hypothetical protein